MKKLIAIIALVASTMAASAAVTIRQSGGWLESAWAEFTMTGYDSCAVYAQSITGTPIQLDAQLIRRYSDHWRADALGLKMGTYTIRIVPINKAGQAIEADQASVGNLVVKNYDRNGFAHFNRPDKSVGVGAYNDDGTLKAGARVLYVSAANCKTVQLKMRMDSKGTEQVRTGLQHILSAYEKASETRPLAIRIIGCIPVEALDSIGSIEEGLQIKGKSYTPIYLTMEGVGNDAAIHGFGIMNRSVSYVEFRNFAVLNCMDDCIGFNTENSFGWVHNMDFFYGKTGGETDQAKGDGTIDLKDLSKDITISYNHFFDSGKSSLCGMKKETADCQITYHHNWFDHSDSRHPRIRTMSVHIYNNYYDGNAKYGVGATSGCSAFAENNYFRNCKYPFLSAGQGTDAQGDGTFSGEAGGIIKVYGNYMTGQKGYRTYAQYGNNSDVYEVKNRADQVPESVKTIKNTNKDGEVFGNTYNNFDQAILSAITPDAAKDVPAIVTGEYGAGRCQKGNISWTFANDEDSNYGVIAELKTKVTDYATSAAVTDLKYILGIGENTFTPAPKPEPGTGGYELYWDNEKNAWSTQQFVINANTTKRTQTITLLDGTEVDVAYGIKFETGASITFTAPSACTLKITFQEGQTANVYLDGVKKTDTSNSLSIAIAAGEHVLAKADSRNIFYIGLDGVVTGVQVTSDKVQVTKRMQNGKIVIERNNQLFTIDGQLLR